MRRNAAGYYSQFLTRLLMDLASVIVPYQTIATSQMINNFFNISNKDKLRKDIQQLYHFGNDYGGGDVIAEPGSYPLLWTFAALDCKRNDVDGNYPQLVNTDPDFKAYASNFLRQLSFNMREIEVLETVEQMSFLLLGKKDLDSYYTPAMKMLSKRKWASEIYQFCDLVLFHQLKEQLLRQLAVPYHVNVSETRRWTYKAKEHQMFIDLIVLDECRYVYDWMPTLDILESGIDNIERQLIYRFALDSVPEHKRWHNTEVLSGTAVIDQFTETFDAKGLRNSTSIL